MPPDASFADSAQNLDVAEKKATPQADKLPGSLVKHSLNKKRVKKGKEPDVDI